MKMPWHNQTGLTKLAAILATTLGIAIGLCGVNFVAFIRFVPLSGPAPPPGTPEWPGRVLTFTGFLELASMALSLAGLILIAIIAIARAIKNHFTY